MTTAIVTGASAGLGREYALEAAKYADEIWLIARRADRLEALKALLPGKRVVALLHVINAAVGRLDAHTQRLRAGQLAAQGVFHHLDGDAAGGLAALMPAHAVGDARDVGQNEQRVLIVRANEPRMRSGMDSHAFSPSRRSALRLHRSSFFLIYQVAVAQLAARAADIAAHFAADGGGHMGGCERA